MKERITHRRIEVLIATAVCLAVLTVLPAFGTGTQEQGGTAGGDSASIVNQSGFPIVKEAVKLQFTAIQHAWSRNWGDMPMFQNYQEKTGIEIEWNMIPQSDQQEKVNIILASADYPDAMFAPGLVGRVTDAAMEGAIVPLNDLIDQWAPNIRKLFVDHPLVEQVCTLPDGNIYGFMAYDNHSTHQLTNQQMYINEKWLDRLGLEMPTTIDEFYDVLKAFKEQDANGNGDPNDEMPLAFWTGAGGEISQWITLFGPWGVVDTQMIENGTVFWGFLDDGYREGLKYWRKLYRDGLLEMESISQTMNQMKAKSMNSDGVPVLGCSYALAPQFIWNNNDLVFLYIDNLSARSMDEVKLNPKREIWIVPPLAGPTGTRMWQHNPGGGNIRRDRAFIFNVNEYPEATTRWFDTFFENKWALKMHLGEEGINWVVGSDGYYTEQTTPEGMNRNEFRAQSCPGSGGFGPYYYDRDTVPKKPIQSRHVMLEKQTNVYLDYIPEETFPNAFVYPTEEENDFLTQYEQEMMNYAWEMTAKFIFGDMDIDAQWPKFVEQCKSMKADEILKIRQAQYDRFLQK